MFNDGMPSIIQQVNVRLGAVDLPPIRQYNLMCNAFMYYCSSDQYMRKQGWNAGYYLDYLSSVSNYSSSVVATVNLNAATGGAPVAPVALGVGAGGAIPAGTTAPVSAGVMTETPDPLADIKARAITGAYYTLPLSLVSIARCAKLIPLDLFDYIEIQITFEAPGACMLWDAGSTPTYTISEPYLLYKQVKCAPEIAEQLTALGKMSDVGFAMALEGFDCIRQPIQLSSLVSVPVQISKSKVKSLFAAWRFQPYLLAGTVQSLTELEALEFKYVQWLIGSTPVSSYRIGDVGRYTAGAFLNAAELSAHTDKALNVWNSHDASGLVSAKNFIESEKKNAITLPPRQLLGEDLETVAGVMCGANLKSGSPYVYFTGELGAMPAATTSAECNIMHQFDYVALCQGGAVSIRD